MKTERYFLNGVLTRQVVDGVEVTENIGKTYSELGITPPKHVTKSVNVSKPFKPISQDEWPVWAKTLKHFSKPEDKGIGDVVARMIGAENSAAFKAWHVATFGKPCNCTARQARWNRLYPLNE